MKYVNLRCQNASIVFFFFFSFFISCNQLDKKHQKFDFTNSLINETSPYLLQHAHNPVNWRAWGQEAFSDAKRENKLVLISIGYSSCHWCHVMEEETFSDKEVAKVMNENYVNIKVDREERPDVDDVYMTAVQLIKGNGGWPLNVIALPNGKPLYGGTYHTKGEWGKVLFKINELYHNNPEQAEQYAEDLTNGIKRFYQIESDSLDKGLDKKNLTAIINKSKMQWDTIWGGNVNSQKFMLPSNLDFLLDYGTVFKDSITLNHLKLTLDNIAIKGVYDHIDGGFFRYSTDEKWQIPHFEKMLYDNAQLISTYSKAYKVYKDPLYRKTVAKTIYFLKDKLKNDSGTYFTSLDAGVEEGAYYLWSEEELSSIITKNLELFKSYYSIKKANELSGGKYHLFNNERDDKFAEENSLTNEAFQKMKKSWIKSLIEARAYRDLPNIDDKIIVSWNALLISGLIDAYTAFGNDDYLQSAISIFETLKSKAFVNNRLIHSYKPNSKVIKGFLDDYAFLQKAALKLFFATTDEQYLHFAETLNKVVMSEFSSDKSNMFTYSNSEQLISKIIKTDDGVMPSANAVMARNFFLLGHLNYEKELLERSRNMLQAIIPYSKENPNVFSSWNSLLLKTTLPFYEIAVVGKDAKKQLLQLNKVHIPNSLVVGTSRLSSAPLFRNRFVENETYIYVCKEKTCKLPVKKPENAFEQLKNF